MIDSDRQAASVASAAASAVASTRCGRVGLVAISKKSVVGAEREASQQTWTTQHQPPKPLITTAIPPPVTTPLPPKTKQQKPHKETAPQPYTPTPPQPQPQPQPQPPSPCSASSSHSSSSSDAALRPRIRLDLRRYAAPPRCFSCAPIAGGSPRRRRRSVRDAWVDWLGVGGWGVRGQGWGFRGRGVLFGRCNGSRGSLFAVGVGGA